MKENPMSRLPERERRLKTPHAALTHFFSFLSNSVWPLGEFPLSCVFLGQASLQTWDTASPESFTQPVSSAWNIPSQAQLPGKTPSHSEVCLVCSVLLLIGPVSWSWLLHMYLWPYLLHFVTITTWKIMNSLRAATDIKNSKAEPKMCGHFLSPAAGQRL